MNCPRVARQTGSPTARNERVPLEDGWSEYDSADGDAPGRASTMGSFRTRRRMSPMSMSTAVGMCLMILLIGCCNEPGWPFDSMKWRLRGTRSTGFLLMLIDKDPIRSLE